MVLESCKTSKSNGVQQPATALILIFVYNFRTLPPHSLSLTKNYQQKHFITEFPLLTHLRRRHHQQILLHTHLRSTTFKETSTGLAILIMAPGSRGTSPFLAALHFRLPVLILFFLAMILVNGCSGHRIIKSVGLGAAKTNCCTVTWGSLAAKPTVVFSVPMPDFWTLSSAVVGDIDFDELDMDESQFEVLRMDRVRLAVQWAECLANDWPELDLQWCLADWHDGKLVPDSR
jgi:hypothetical protein